MDLGITGEKLNNEEKQRLGVGSAVAERMEVLLLWRSHLEDLGAGIQRKQG